MLPTSTVRRHQRSPLFSLANISVTVQLWIQVFWIISVQFDLRNTLPMSGPFLLLHPVYIYIYILWDQINAQKMVRVKTVLNIVFLFSIYTMRVYTHTHTHINTYIHTYLCMCVYIYIYIYICVCVCVCIYIFIYLFIYLFLEYDYDC